MYICQTASKNAGWPSPTITFQIRDYQSRGMRSFLAAVPKVLVFVPTLSAFAAAGASCAWQLLMHATQLAAALIRSALSHQP